MSSFIIQHQCQWKALPKEYGASSSVHDYFREWISVGFFKKIWQTGLERYDEIEGIDWSWLSLDASMVKAPLAQESVGKNPTDRGKGAAKEV